MVSPVSPSPPGADPFDRTARRAQRRRAIPGADFLARELAAELAARVAVAGPSFAIVADIGGSGVVGDVQTVRIDVAATGGVGLIADEDRLPLADGSVDLVAALVGGTTLAEVRADLLAAEVAVTGRAAARVLPMVDPAAAPGLLQRAGFADPVVEVDTLTLRYDDLGGVLRDLRAAGAGNILRGREPLRRDVLTDAAARFAARAVGGRVAVTVQVIYLTGRG